MFITHELLFEYIMNFNDHHVKHWMYFTAAAEVGLIKTNMIWLIEMESKDSLHLD